MQVGLVQSVERIEQRATSCEPEGIEPADLLWAWTASPPWVSSLQAYSPDFAFEPVPSHEPIL